MKLGYSSSTTRKAGQQDPHTAQASKQLDGGEIDKGGNSLAGGSRQSMRGRLRSLKKELLLRAACEAFYEHGFHDTTVDMITDKLDSTKAVFYYNFKDKQAVLREIYLRALVSAQEVIDSAISTGGSAKEILANIARNYTTWVIENQILVGVFWREERSLLPKHRAEIARAQKKFDDTISTVLTRGVEERSFVISDIQTTSRAISGMISFLYTWWRRDRRIDGAVMAEHYSALALRIAGCLPVNPHSDDIDKGQR